MYSSMNTKKNYNPELTAALINSITEPQPFDPNLLIFTGFLPDCPYGHNFLYKGMVVCWTAQKANDKWLLALSISGEAFYRLSPKEIDGLLKETGFEPRIKSNMSFQRSSMDPNQILCYFTQELPEEPVMAWNKVGIMYAPANYRQCIEAMLTFDPDNIRQAIGKNLILSDDAAIVSAHKCLAVSPCISGSRRIESVKWLHEHGYHVVIDTGKPARTM